MIIIESKKTGRRLDLRPEQEITFTLENPLFADDRMPVAVSTAIEFELSPLNKTEFGFVDAMLLSPLIQQIPARIFSYGIEIFSGDLRFDEFSDGRLKYTFVDTGAAETISGKLYEIETESYNDVKLSAFVNSARANAYSDIGLPMIIRRQNSAKIEYHTVAGDAECSIIDKYANHLYSQTPHIVPVFKVPYLLNKIIPGINLPAAIKNYVDQLAIVGTYKPKTWSNLRYGIPVVERLGRPPEWYVDSCNLAESLPEMTNADFLYNILTMFCATLFIGSDEYIILNNKDIIQDITFDDWTAKVAEIYSIISGEDSVYSLEYENDAGSFNPKQADDLGEGELTGFIATCSSYEQMLEVFKSSASYTNIQLLPSRNIYSGKAIQACLYFNSRYPISWYEDETTIPSLDIVYHASVEKQTLGTNTEKAHTTKIAFSCAKCIPASIATPLDKNGIRPQVTLRSMTPVVDFPTIGGDRPSVAHIGLLINNNFIDQGNYFTTPIPFEVEGSEATNNNLSIAISGNSGLYNLFHEPFATWMTKKKETIKAEVYLHPTDIANLQLWRKKMIYNRLFLIKQIEITITDSTEIAFANTELIET